MDGVKISEIPFALLSKKEMSRDIEPNGTNDKRLGYNSAIDQQGQVRLSLSREILAERLYLSDYPSPPNEYIDFKILGQSGRDIYLKKADFLIKNQKDLFVVVKE